MTCVTFTMFPAMVPQRDHRESTERPQRYHREAAAAEAAAAEAAAVGAPAAAEVAAACPANYVNLDTLP